MVSYLFEHIQIVIVIAVVIFTLLSKVRGSARGNGRPMMPPFGGGTPTKSDRHRPMPQPQQAQEQRQVRTQSASPRPREAEPRIGMPLQTSAPTGPRLGGGPALTRADLRASSSSPYEPAEPSSYASGSTHGSPSRSAAYPGEIGSEPFALDRDELARGIVWAEILGPPRAKKPYTRR